MALIQLAPVPLVRSGILSVSVADCRDHAGATEGELHLLIRMRLKPALLVDCSDSYEGKILTVSMHYGSVRGEPQPDGSARRRENAFRDGRPARRPTAFSVPGVYGTEKVALNSCSRPVGCSRISLPFKDSCTVSARSRLRSA